MEKDKEDKGNGNGLITRKPDSSMLEGVDVTKPQSISGCIDFSVQNVGNERVHIGFTRDQQPHIPINPNEFSSWPLYRPCEVWEGEVFVKFGANGSSVIINKTL